MSEFGEWIRLTRRSKGFTATECAERAGMKVQMWSRWEGGGKQAASAEVPHPRRETVLAIAKGLQVPEADALKAAGYLPNPPVRFEQTDADATDIVIQEDGKPYVPGMTEEEVNQKMREDPDFAKRFERIEQRTETMERIQQKILELLQSGKQ